LETPKHQAEGSRHHGQIVERSHSISDHLSTEKASFPAPIFRTVRPVSSGLAVSRAELGRVASGIQKLQKIRVWACGRFFNWIRAIITSLFLKYTITIHETMSLSLQFCRCMRYANIYAWRPFGPIVGCIEGYYIFVWTKLPLLRFIFLYISFH
jgi:hypothetical protein